MNLKNKTAIITGASRGIGFAIAQEFCANGARVMLCSRSEKAITDASENLRNQNYEAQSVQADISKKKDIDKLIDKTIEQFSSIDILVNNAGITRDRLLMRMKDEDWKAVLETNLTGAAYCTRAVLRPMMRQKSGRIINISSVVGLMGNPGQANYAAAKAGMVGLTKSIAKEVASRGIAVNAIAPGFIESDMTAQISEENQRKILEQIPMGIFGRPEDVAKVALFLAKPSTNYITGQVIQVDGGMVM